LSDAPDCCEPGDITIAQIYGGWLIGRALEQQGPGPWWSYVALVADFDVAVRRARELARADGVRAWFHEGIDVYHPIPLDDSPYEPPSSGT
jgi:hypothetical protein